MSRLKLCMEAYGVVEIAFVLGLVKPAAEVPTVGASGVPSLPNDGSAKFGSKVADPGLPGKAPKFWPVTPGLMAPSVPGLSSGAPMLCDGTPSAPRFGVAMGTGGGAANVMWSDGLAANAAVAPATTNTEQHRAAQLGSRLGQAIRALDQPAGMSGVRIKLRYRERERE